MKRLYEWVSVGIAQGEQDGKPLYMVGLGFPKTEPDPDDPAWNDPDNFEDFFLTPYAARDLIVALEDALRGLEGGE